MRALICASLISLAATACCRDNGSSQSPPPSQTTAPGEAHPVAIRVTDQGFEPPEVHLKQGQLSQLEFTRTTESECLNAVRMPWMKKAIPLPIGQKVAITVPTEKAGRFVYACWMNMIFGRVVIDAQK